MFRCHLFQKASDDLFDTFDIRSSDDKTHPIVQHKSVLLRIVNMVESHGDPHYFVQNLNRKPFGSHKDAPTLLGLKAKDIVKPELNIPKFGGGLSSPTRTDVAKRNFQMRAGAIPRLRRQRQRLICGIRIVDRNRRIKHRHSGVCVGKRTMVETGCKIKSTCGTTTL